MNENIVENLYPDLHASFQKFLMINQGSAEKGDSHLCAADGNIKKFYLLLLILII